MPTLACKVCLALAARLQWAADARQRSRSMILRKALKQKLGLESAERALLEVMRSSVGSPNSGYTDLGHNPRHMALFGRI
jgi:hypothetical protein